MRHHLLSAAVPVFALLVTGCTKKTSADWPNVPGPKVVVTFAPIHSFVTNVMGDRGHVKTILATTGPHDYQPTTDDAKHIDGADLFFSNGLGLEGNLIKSIKASRSNSKVAFVDLGGRLDEKTLLEADDHDHGAPGHTHTHDSEFNPHVWLGLEQAKKMVETIRDELKKVDPPLAAEYDANAARYCAELDRLISDGKQILSGIPKEKRTFVTMHDSLGYFAKTFDLTVAGVIELTPGQEPSRKELDALIEACTKNKVRVIAVEPQYSSAGGAKAIERELRNRGLDPVVIDIDPLETATKDELSPGLYVKTMRANLKALAEALKK